MECGAVDYLAHAEARSTTHSPVLASSTSHHPFEEARYYVVILERPPESSTRRLENHEELMARLREWLPEDEGFTFDTFAPGNPMWKTAERVYKGCLVIGLMGATCRISCS
jgi:hypothetical protein